MAATTYLIKLVTDRPVRDLSFANFGKNGVCMELERVFGAFPQGMLGFSSLDIQSGAVAASGTLTLSTASGTVGGTIAGVAKTVTWATSDTATATALAAAINADATLKTFVSAAAVGGVVT